VLAPYLFLVVPCYNEARRFDRDAFRAFALQTRFVHLVFVDDGSSDSTRSLLAELRVGLEDRISVVSYSENKGKAEAVRTGVLHALNCPSCTVFGFWDADLATPLGSVERLARVLEENQRVDLVCGSRVKLCGRNIQRQRVRHYMGRVFATVVSIVLNLAIYDTQCGAKLFRVTDEMRAVFAQPFLSRWIFDVEILARMIAGTDPKSVEAITFEYPLEEWRDISGSKLRPRDFFLAIYDIARIKRRYL
jgi:dolichyl-phosphate beta-glucosyltransferase